VLIVRAVTIGFEDSDSEERRMYAGALLRLLKGADEVRSVDWERTATPDGAKGLGLDAASILIGLSGGLPGVVSMIDAWRTRQRAGTVRLEVDGDVLELEDIDAEAQARLIRIWLSRHDVPADE
jgi:Effector Associated Constant Component 1